MNVEINHQLTEQEAQTRIKHLIGNLRNQFGERVSEISETWHSNNCDFSFKVEGLQITGKMLIENKMVKITGSLPLIAKMFQGLIEERIKAEAEKLLA